MERVLSSLQWPLAEIVVIYGPATNSRPCRRIQLVVLFRATNVGGAGSRCFLSDKEDLFEVVVVDKLTKKVRGSME